MHERYGDHALPESERATITGYWHYRFFYEEELHIAAVDGARGEGRSGWPYAYSISLPSGQHNLEFVILRNSGKIVTCDFVWTFEREHDYKLRRLDHEQLLLAHPSSSPFTASIAMKVTSPSGLTRDVEVPAVCAK